MYAPSALRSQHVLLGTDAIKVPVGAELQLVSSHGRSRIIPAVVPVDEVVR